MSTETTTSNTAAETEQTDATVGVSEVEDERNTVTVENAPTRLSQAITLVAATIGVALTAPFTILALPFAVAGLGLVAGSLVVAYSRNWLTVGIGLVLFGAIISGGFGAVPPEFLLIGVSATLLAFDVGQYGIGVGEQLGRQTQTRRLETTHATATVIALTVANAFVYAIYLFAGDGRPAPAVALLLIGVIMLMWVYRN